MAEDTKKINDEIADYSASLAKGYSAICDLLRSEIEQALHGAMSKLYHSAPVWFIDSIPIVGYNATQQSVTLLFWSGQSFNEPDLTPTGKFKAAQIKYQNVNDISTESLRRWLEKSKETIWNYKGLLKTGELALYKGDIGTF
jgi:hypothetical protein